MKFSFPGLKTSLQYFLEKCTDLAKDMIGICVLYQEAMLNALRLNKQYIDDRIAVINKARY